MPGFAPESLLASAMKVSPFFAPIAGLILLLGCRSRDGVNIAPPPPPPLPPLVRAPPPGADVYTEITGAAGPATPTAVETVYLDVSHHSEYPAPLYFYLLFDDEADRQVEASALSALICNYGFNEYGHPLDAGVAPIIIPVKRSVGAAEQPHDPTTLRLFITNLYDFSDARQALVRLGLSSHDVYLVASRTKFETLPPNAARVRTPDLRVIDLSHTSPRFVPAAIHSVLIEALDGSLFKGPSAQDRGYVFVSFLDRVGSSFDASFSIAAHAATNADISAEASDQGSCH